MRFRVRPHVTLSLLLTLGLIAGGVAWFRPRAVAYAAGWLNAEVELWQGSPTIAGVGGLRQGPTLRIDWETGLPIAAVVEHINSASDSAYIEGHNARIHSHVQRCGIPASSFKTWEDQLLDLSSTFDRDAQRVAPTRLLPSGAPLTSPDGTLQIRPGFIDHDPEAFHTLAVELHRGNRHLASWNLRWQAGDTDLDWGPAGTPFVIVRNTFPSPGRTIYQAFDLRAGRFLLDEWWVGEQRTQR